ncbi:hypothetical protein SEA_GODONK_168 [Gordonia phage GodonK]|uniref:Uncharacterized protein n=1 Tax=Gordonia phage GodonK TaxID=2562192 RepID=A0A4D6E2C0_9CAUD|nr:hypothetical protein HOV33_gp200 [Gordonia phage GodonK]QBZ72756.1 hypothetical protein SEA_GODONK_168 [Gordonia phage GodonK]
MFSSIVLPYIFHLSFSMTSPEYRVSPQPLNKSTIAAAAPMTAAFTFTSVILVSPDC